MNDRAKCLPCHRRRRYIVIPRVDVSGAIDMLPVGQKRVGLKEETVVWCGVVRCAEGAVTKWQWPGCLACG